MIESRCGCGARFRLAENVIGGGVTCSRCGAPALFVCAEALPEGAGAEDFDASLVVVNGPGDVGRRFFLGGISDIEIGNLPEHHIGLPGSQLVGPLHCTLVRIDFGPSRWRVEGHVIAHGLVVNGKRADGQELRNGDQIRIGDYELRYDVAGGPKPASEPDVPPSTGVGPVCPSCQRRLAPGARICVACGIHLASGRPLLTARSLDEADLHAKAEETISALSWLLPFGLYPIASEAFGTRRPYAIWTIFAVTVLVSLAVSIAGWSRDENAAPPALTYMLWVGDPKVLPTLEDFQVPDEVLRHWSPQEQRQALARLSATLPHGEFRWYQLLTHALLHEGLLHLAGNMLFLLVLGSRVNALIGNPKTAVIYPLLAVAGGVGELLASRHSFLHPTLGASGAIMGLAGMYLILFPVHRVFMSVWLRFGFRECAIAIWRVRGFWVVLFFISFDVLYTSLGIRDHVAHWAHLGGFLAGGAVALGLLVSRLVNARGGDLLSVVFGKRAWPLIGRPARWQAERPAIARATRPAR